MSTQVGAKFRKPPQMAGPYKVVGILGQGAHSQVKLVEKEGIQYAAKFISKRQDISRHILDESLEIIRMLHHPGLMSLKEFIDTTTDYVYILPYAEQGELLHLIQSNGVISEEQAKPLFRQILEALLYLHKMKICHRDIKPENIFVMSDQRLMLSDFSISTFVPDDGMVTGCCGTPNYMAPEVQTCASYNGYLADNWSLGVTLYVMLTQRFPWSTKTPKKRSSFKAPMLLSPECRELLHGLIRFDVESRWTVEQALQCDWLKGVPQQFSVPVILPSITLPMIPPPRPRSLSAGDAPEGSSSGQKRRKKRIIRVKVRIKKSEKLNSFHSLQQKIPAKL